MDEGREEIVRYESTLLHGILENEMSVDFCNTSENCVEFYNIFFPTKSPPNNILSNYSKYLKITFT
jgi:hypothetical protein